MRSSWSEPYLWIHLAGIAALPIFLEICLLGFAMGDPILPTGLEWLLVAGFGIAPIFWMQWQRPFYIYSLLLVALKPENLTDDQRRFLRLFKTSEVKVLTIISAVLLAILLWQLYYLSPIASNLEVLASGSRILGLLIAAIAFLGCNLFLQVPVSVLRVMLASDGSLAALPPYPLEQIAKDFMLFGLRVKQILPPIVAQPEPLAATPARSPVTLSPDLSPASGSSPVEPQPEAPSVESQLPEPAPPTAPEASPDAPQAPPLDTIPAPSSTLEALSDSDASAPPEVSEPSEQPPTPEAVESPSDIALPDEELTSENAMPSPEPEPDASENEVKE